MSISLDSLLLSPEELEAALRQVRELAYFEWEAAGRPAGRELETRDARAIQLAWQRAAASECTGPSKDSCRRRSHSH